MKHMALGIGYRADEHAVVRREWEKYDVDFDFVSTVEEAVHWIGQKEYVCISAFADQIGNEQLALLRSMNAPPIVLLSPGCSVSQRAIYLHRGAADFILHERLQKASGGEQDAVRYYLDSPYKATEPLTIITTEDIYFCLEYRTVRVRGQEVNLTPFEFTALHLLLSSPKRTLTFEVISVRVWGEEYIDNPPKAVNNLISRLRNKLKVEPDVQDNIKSIHNVGYRYDVEM